MAALPVLLILVWFATTGMRDSKATDYDKRAGSALDAGDYRTAFRNAQLALALKPTNDRRLTAAAAAYRSGDNRQVIHDFETDDPEYNQQALLVDMAAAARQGDENRYRKRRDQLKVPSDELMRAGVARAALDAGDLTTARSASAEAVVLYEVYPYAVSYAVDNPAAAQAVLKLADEKEPARVSKHRAFNDFYKDLVSIPKETKQTLETMATGAEKTTAKASRYALVSQGLYKLGDYRAAVSAGLAAVHENNQYRDGWNTLAIAQMALDETRDAERSLKSSLDSDQAFGYTWYLKSELAKQQGDEDEEKEYRRKAEGLGFKLN